MKKVTLFLHKNTHQIIKCQKSFSFFKRMVRLKYPIILISKLDSGPWVCSDNIFFYKNIFWFEAYSKFYFLHVFVQFSQKIVSSVQLCLCGINVGKRKKKTFYHFFTEKRVKLFILQREVSTKILNTNSDAINKNKPQ